jgi:uncharacterized membrane protein
MDEGASGQQTGILPSSPDLAPSADLEAWTARLGVFVTGIVLLRLGFELWWTGRLHEHTWVQAGIVLVYALGITLLALAFLRIDHAQLDRWGLAALVVTLEFYAIVTLLVVTRHYTSDALLFVHESAAQFIAGNNPYTLDLVGGYEAFQVPYYVQTPTSSGGIITNLNYPALSFLIYAPFVALGLEDMRIVSMGFLLSLVVLTYRAVPRHLRLLSVSVLFLSSFFLSFSLSGFDIVFVFFLAAACVLWNTDRRAAWFLYGLSAAVKQTVWFIGPFLLVLQWKSGPDGRSRDAKIRGLVEGLGWAGLAFVVPNLWFILQDPVAWLTGVLTPFGLLGDSLVPLAQGLTVPIYAGTVHVDPWLLRFLAGSALIGLLILYWTSFETMRDIAWFVPPLVLAFAERSLQNYFEMFYPIALLVLVRSGLYGSSSGTEPEDQSEGHPAPSIDGPENPVGGRSSGPVGETPAPAEGDT